jgi:hypothetical protein
MNIQDLADKSSDSHLKLYSFRDGVLEIHLDTDYFDSEVIISIPTDVVSGTEISNKDKVLRNCRIELTKLEKNLNSEQGYYVPSSDFGNLMKEVRTGISLAYGKKISEIKWQLSIVGYSRLISCLTGDLDKIFVSFSEDL